MSELKKMYTTMGDDPFPAELKLRVGEEELVFAKKTWTIAGEEKGLRYGENPDQPAALYRLEKGTPRFGDVSLRGAGAGLVSGITAEDMIQAGKHPGKINLTDVDNGINILQYLSKKPAAVILKHNNPCGAAWSPEGIATALDQAFWADRIAAFGGTIVVNRPLDKQAAEIINSAYFEVVAAPDFEAGAVDILKQRKNLRIIRMAGLAELEPLTQQRFLDIKSLTDGGMILQYSFRNSILTPEDFLPAKAEKDGNSIAARKPTEKEADDLLFAWAVEAGVASNSVLFAKDGATVAVGTGEQDRVGCVELTVYKAYTKYADRLCFNEHALSLYELKARALGRVQDEKMQQDRAAELLADIESRTKEAKGGLVGSAMVSDGFFPFRDGVDVALAEGIAAIAQPGGSIRDYEVVEAVNRAVPQAAMVFTGQRSFKH